MVFLLLLLLLLIIIMYRINEKREKKKETFRRVFSEHVRGEFGRDSHNGRLQERCDSDVRGAVAQIVVARATVFDAYVRGHVDGARPVVRTAVRSPSARSDYHQLAVHCNYDTRYYYYK